MTRTSAPRPDAPSAARDLNLVVEPISLAPEEIPEFARTTGNAPQAILEPGDDHYYAQHWGINE